VRKTIEQVQEEIEVAREHARKKKKHHTKQASMEFTHGMVASMRRLGISRSELARMTGVKPAYVSKLLRGTTNFTLATMVKIANALSCELRCYLQPIRRK
jgi:ribosome-binding protein aMBF1 (putative translation factor)